MEVDGRTEPAVEEGLDGQVRARSEKAKPSKRAIAGQSSSEWPTSRATRPDRRLGGPSTAGRVVVVGHRRTVGDGRSGGPAHPFYLNRTTVPADPPRYRNRTPGRPGPANAAPGTGGCGRRSSDELTTIPMGRFPPSQPGLPPACWRPAASTGRTTTGLSPRSPCPSAAYGVRPTPEGPAPAVPVVAIEPDPGPVPTECVGPPLTPLGMAELAASQALPGGPSEVGEFADRDADRPRRGADGPGDGRARLLRGGSPAVRTAGRPRPRDRPRPSPVAPAAEGPILPPLLAFDPLEDRATSPVEPSPTAVDPGPSWAASPAPEPTPAAPERSLPDLSRSPERASTTGPGRSATRRPPPRRPPLPCHRRRTRHPNGRDGPSRRARTSTARPRRAAGRRRRGPDRSAARPGASRNPGSQPSPAPSGNPGRPSRRPPRARSGRPRPVVRGPDRPGTGRPGPDRHAGRPTPGRAPERALYDWAASIGRPPAPPTAPEAVTERSLPDLSRSPERGSTLPASASARRRPAMARSPERVNHHGGIAGRSRLLQESCSENFAPGSATRLRTAIAPGRSGLSCCVTDSMTARPFLTLLGDCRDGEDRPNGRLWKPRPK